MLSVVANTCGGEISENNGYIQSPGYPSTTNSGMCSFTVKKCDSNICQYRYGILKALKFETWTDLNGL